MRNGRGGDVAQRAQGAERSEQPERESAALLLVVEQAQPLQEQHGPGGIPVVMFSGQAEADEEAATRGAQGFVGKPFDLQRLIDQTKTLLPV